MKFIYYFFFVLFSMMNYYSMITKSPMYKIPDKLITQSLNWKW